MDKRTEREFLALAYIYLRCRHQAIQGCDVPGWPWRGLAVALLGMQDYAAEMRLLITQERDRLSGNLPRSASISVAVGENARPASAPARES